MKILSIGAHQDDNEFRVGGMAYKWVKAGHEVRFLSMCNGCGGHHFMTPEETSARRAKESAAVAEYVGLKYDIWSDIDDCTIMPDLELRYRTIRYIREFAPDLIICHRTNDYHADHRISGQLVQDASYILTVPHTCPDTPHLEQMPVIVYNEDSFKNPPFVPDMIVDIDDVIDKKYLLWNCHTSQFYEWLPYTNGTLDTVPEGAEERLEWLHYPRVSRDTPRDLSELSGIKTPSGHGEAKEAVYAARYRDLLVSRYGENGKKVIFAEAYETSEYGTPLTEENAKVLFPF